MVSEVKQRSSATKPIPKKDSSDSPQSPKKNDTSDKKTSESGTGAGPQKKIGHLGIKKEDQIWSRAVLMTGVLVIVIVMKWRKTNEITWASRQDVLTKAKAQPLICSTPYFDELKQFEGNTCFLLQSMLFKNFNVFFFTGCKIKQCGRFVVDGLFSEDQINTLLGIFQKGLEFGSSSGGASILDLHSGALSKGERFINVYSNPETRNIWSDVEMASYV